MDNQFSWWLVFTSTPLLKSPDGDTDRQLAFVRNNVCCDSSPLDAWRYHQNSLFLVHFSTGLTLVWFFLGAAAAYRPYPPKPMIYVMQKNDNLLVTIQIQTRLAVTEMLGCWLFNRLGSLIHLYSRLPREQELASQKSSLFNWYYCWQPWLNIT